MSIVETTYRCDWSGCNREISVSSRPGFTEKLPNLGWEIRISGRHACPMHRCYSSRQFEAAINPPPASEENS